MIVSISFLKWFSYFVGSLVLCISISNYFQFTCLLFCKQFTILLFTLLFWNLRLWIFMLKLLRKIVLVPSKEESQLKAVPWNSNQRWHSTVPEDTRHDILPQRSQKWTQWLLNTEAQTTITLSITIILLFLHLNYFSYYFVHILLLWGWAWRHW